MTRKQRSIGGPDLQDWSALAVAVAERQDRDSFMRIYDHFAPRLRRYLLNLGASQSLADELVQETLLALWRKASLFDPSRATLNAWLYRIARNLHIDQARREPYWRPIQEGLEQLDLAETDRHDSQPEDYVDGRALEQAIDRLPVMQARLVRMSYLEAKSHGEIARELDMPLGSVKSTLRRAFTRLRAAMDPP
ncbi:MAG: sigma-70 family RNA polymerase sigma factor [Luteimonas sp.]